MFDSPRVTRAHGAQRRLRGRLAGRGRVAIGGALAAVCAFTSPIAAAASLPTRTLPLTVYTPYGELQGVSVDSAQEFLGIPFAQPPVGALRFSLPQPPSPWSGVRQANSAGPACVQFAHGTLPPGYPASEDCLYLNVYRPSTVPVGEPLPVMVWIHGGGDVFGGTEEYDAHQLAERTNTIVVTVAYRLGALGYLDLPGLDAEDPGVGSGNYATLDQIQALRWVRQDIAAFGGNPGNVTIFGQSSGANSVCVLLASPLAAGTFAKAIIESQGCDTIGHPLAMAQAQSEAFATAAGCTGTAGAVVGCLRAASTATLVAAAQAHPIAVAVSGTPVEPLPSGVAISEGRWYHVPILLGSTQSEGKFFVVGESSITAPEYDGFISQTYGANAAAVLARYPASAYPAPFYALAQVATDSALPVPLSPWGISCLVNTTANEFAGQTPVYRYEFNDPTSATAAGFDPPGVDMANAHLAELNYIFQWLPVARPLTSVEIPLSLQMQQYWAAFARSSNPNVSGQPVWPQYHAGSAQTLELSPYGDTVETDTATQHNCAFWGDTPVVNVPPAPPGQ
jgi:para-nitrobenzyl esterase